MSPDQRLAAEVRGLVGALRRHAPQRDWTPRRHREVFEAAARSRTVHPDVVVDATGLCGPVPAEQHTPGVHRGDQILLYFHGGGFIMGSTATSRPMASHLAAMTGRTVVVPDYDLAPEYRFPHQVDQATLCYDALTRSTGKPVVLVGDSAGGALSLRVAQSVGADKRPAALVLLSPFLDLRLCAASIDANDEFDPQTPRWLLEQMVGHYLNGVASPEDPAVSPLLGELAGLPPTLVQVAELEGLHDDAVAFARAATAAGSPVDLETWPGMIHVWHYFVPRLPQAVAALQRLGEWLDDVVPTAPRVIRSHI
ncbi:alpha/beta hydrolase [Mycobacterium sp. NAZ190054]|uniref:alpha/beta hydrolase n=1 Tax=Mycobacterium sp. NAZ190054 TaxID=1747766 RepID=UPI0007934D22|nr:alpha/beta hydrolase [Mycobacterium sp. NAZ190054]KWX68755.1 hypothetical protein ASJ79_16335 [Mycobacterium sp. NAZ190054]